MLKYFINVTPDRGNGNETVVVKSKFNTERKDKNTTLSFTATGNNSASKTIPVSLQKGFSNTIGNWSGILTCEISQNSTPKTNIQVDKDTNTSSSYLTYTFLEISLKIKSTDSSSELNLIAFVISISTEINFSISGIAGYYIEENYQQVMLVGSDDITYISGYALNDTLNEYTFQFKFLDKTWKLSIQASKQ